MLEAKIFDLVSLNRYKCILYLLLLTWNWGIKSFGHNLVYDIHWKQPAHIKLEIKTITMYLPICKSVFKCLLNDLKAIFCLSCEVHFTIELLIPEIFLLKVKTFYLKIFLKNNRKSTECFELFYKKDLNDSNTKKIFSLLQMLLRNHDVQLLWNAVSV